MADGVGGAQLAGEAYARFADVLREVDEEQSWTATGCTGWAVRDLTLHCVGDAQRALVALHTPTEEPADRDAVSYWGDWGPDPAGAANGRRHIRVGASMFLHWEQLRELYLETTDAAVHAARQAHPERRVRTQSHVLTSDDLLRTLAVEATVHHLDLVRDLPHAPGPSAQGLGEVRRTLDGLLGATAAVDWTDERYALVATGRAQATEEEARSLGALYKRLPVFC